MLSTNLGFEIKTETTEVAELKAVIDKESAIGDDLPLKIDELVASIATAEADLDAARKIRAKEAADFAAEEQEFLVQHGGCCEDHCIGTELPGV